MAEAPRSSPPTGKVEPYVPASKSLPELTIGVLLLGAILSVVLGGANAYLGMFAGMTVSASVPAAVISMGILRALRTGNILQNNAVQTAAASGEGLASGVIFTLPAMVILNKWQHFSYLETTLIAAFGGILGVLFTIPLRRALIIDQPLQFPEGVATAEVLKVGAEGGGGLRVLVLSAVIGAVVKIGATGLKLWAETVRFGGWLSGGTATASAATAAPATGAAAASSGLQRRVGDLRGLGAQPLDRGPAVLGVRRRQRDHDHQQRRYPHHARPGAAGRQRARCRGPLPQVRHALPRRRRHAGRRRVVAVQAAQVAARRDHRRPRGLQEAQRRQPRGDRAHRARHADEHHPDPDRGVGDPAVLHLLALHRLGVGQRGDGGGHGDRGLPVLGGRVVHGGPGRLVEQPGLGDHDLDDPGLGAAAAGAGPQDAGRSDRRGADRRRGVLRGRDRRRQPAGPQVRPARGLDAVEAAGDADPRRGRRGVPDGAGAEPAQ
ncbi:MAG: oligopeptide transporter, OPT family [Deltaproteobacteria bacterium]|nr:MAG: oligopeptide transporter, OPT family [Deltaproteobacteria bacterium]